MKTIKVYFQNSSLHGLRYIVDEKCSWIERLFWLVVVIGSCYFCYTMIMVALSVRLNVSYTVTTDYLNWETHFPAVSICPDYGQLSKVLSTYIPDLKKDFPSHDSTKIYRAISGAIFGEFNYLYIVGECKKGRIKGCPESGYRELYLKYQMNCSSIFLKCSWNDKPFDCCKYFKYFPYYFNRLCFTANNFLNTNEHYPMIYKNGQGILEMVIKPEYFVGFVHSRYDSINPKESHFSLSQGSFSMSLSMTDTETDEDVIIAPIEKRRCRFKHEKIPGYHFPIYGPNLCIESCTIEYMLKHCNCTYASVPNILDFPDGKYCDLDGMQCVSDMKSILEYGSPFYNKNKTLVSCPHCLPTCSETVIDSSKAIPLMMNEQTDYSTLKIYISHQPYLRFKRSLVKNPLDLVVSIGGTMGLFLGASILSLMEFIYYFSIRLIN